MPDPCAGKSTTTGCIHFQIQHRSEFIGWPRGALSLWVKNTQSSQYACVTQKPRIIGEKLCRSWLRLICIQQCLAMIYLPSPTIYIEIYTYNLHILLCSANTCQVSRQKPAINKTVITSHKTVTDPGDAEELLYSMCNCYM